jgi:hypothetical protein
MVGAGAGAELGGGAAVGVAAGGASVGDLDGAGAAVGLALAVTCAAACGAGRLAEAVARARLRWALPGEVLDGAAAGEDVVAAGAAVVLPASVWAGAVRANRVAKPTAVIALSWVARQVRRERRRSPAARAASGCSPVNSGLSRMTGDHSRTRVKGS